MPRKGPVERKPTTPDPVYQSQLVTQLINKVLQRGKKSHAESIVYGALEVTRTKTGTDPIATLKRALENVRPTLEVRSRRVGGATYQVPVEVQADRGLALAIRWLISSARARSGKSMAEKLAAELSDAAKGQGTTIKKREDTHKMAEANRAFAHYRW